MPLPQARDQFPTQLTTWQGIQSGINGFVAHILIIAVGMVPSQTARNLIGRETFRQMRPDLSKQWPGRVQLTLSATQVAVVMRSRTGPSYVVRKF